MRITKESVALANELRVEIQRRTETVSDGEGVAMVLLWSFFMDHARICNLDAIELARGQVEEFIKRAGDAVEMVRAH